MSSSIAFKKKALSMEFVKRTTGLIRGAAGNYISEVMPVSSSTLVDAKSTASKVSSTLKSTSQEVLPKIRNIKSQNPIRSIYKWYMDNENEYDDSDFDQNLNFDSDIDSSEISEFQISESEKNSNKVAKAVVESSRQMVESQIATIANLQNTVEKQTAAIAAGFDKTNESLNKILEVLTKNTATLIEASVAASRSDDPVYSMIRNNKFSLNSYKKIVSSNIKNSTEYALLSTIPTLFSTGFSPDNFMNALFSFGLNKAAPKLKNNLKALDDVINDTIIHSLIRLGNNKNNSSYFSANGYLSKFFGIDTSRENQSTERSSIEVKSVSFDSIAHESITNTIPGYLRKILVALGGEDLVYDYRSRSFKSKGSINKEFMNNAASNGSIYQSSHKVRNALGTSPAANMFYEMLLTRLGTENDITGVLETFNNPETLSKYMKDNVVKGVKFNKNEKKALETFINNFTTLTRNDNNGIMDVMLQARKNNLSRNTRVADYIANANAYNIDLSDINDSVENDLSAILERFGKKSKKYTSSISQINPKKMSGATYTNVALYQIFRRLEEGINVFQVGSSKKQKDPYIKFGNKHLPPPDKYKPKNIKESSKSESLIESNTTSSLASNVDNNQNSSDETSEDLTTGQRIGRWASYRGGNLRRAIFSGSPEQVRSAFGSIISDIGSIAGEQIKKGVSTIDKSFGNVSGFINHKIFGNEYSYQTGVDNDGNPVFKHIAKNEKGGIFGFIVNEFKESFKNGKDNVTGWINSVKSYFDYGDNSNDSEDDQINKKRKKLIFGSLGAFAGAGILGGPIGMIVGALAGNALTSFGLGNRIKNMLFGHDNDGKPTGIISKATDAIVSPIKFQIGKTVKYLGSSLQKNILGPLSDIGMAIKDRITGHIDSTFDKIKKSVGGFFGKIFGKLIGGIGNIGLKLSSGIGNLGVALSGKASRGAIGATGGLIGLSQNLIAGKISKNSYHKLKRDENYTENYTIKKGEKYLDTDGEVKTASEDMNIDGTMGIKPHSKDYIKNRRKSRNDEIDNDLKNSNYYKTGGIKGFFGGDYKAWHSEELRKRQERRNRFNDYISEREMTPEEIAAKEAAEETARNTQTIAEATQSTNNILNEERTGTVNCFKTHDQEIHNRLDDIIEILGGVSRKKKNTESAGNTEVNTSQVDSFVGSTLTAAANMAGSGDVYEGEESQIVSDIIDESGGDRPNKMSISQKLKQLMKIQTKKSEEGGKEKESIFSKITGAIKGGFSSIFGPDGISGVITTALAAFIGYKDIKSFYENVIKGDMNFSEWWGEESVIGRGVTGLMNVSSFIGKVGGPVVNTISKGIETVTKMVPFVPTISPPQIDTTGPFAGLATGILGGLYFKGASAIGSIASAAASLMKSGSNIIANGVNSLTTASGKSTLLKKGLTTASAFALPYLGAKTIVNGGMYNDNSDAAGNDIINQSGTRAATLDYTRGIAHYAFGMTDSVDPLYKKFVQHRATDRMIDAAQAATKHGGDGIKAATTAMKREVVSSGLDTTNLMNKRKVSKIVTKATAEITEEAVDSPAGLRKTINVLKGVLNKFFDFIKKHKSFKKVAGASKYIDDMAAKILKYINIDAFKPLQKKVAAIVSRVTSKDVTGAATAGIGYAVFGILGAVSGATSAANIFNVKEADVTAGMRTIGSVIVAALNAIPLIGYIELVDLILVPATGISFRQFISQGLYRLIGDANYLEESQGKMTSSLANYNSKFGTNLTSTEYNDMTNSSIFGKMWHGKTKTDENGEYIFDDAGKAIQSGGFKGLFVGGHNQYAKDENGNVIIGKDGKAIKAIDKHGRTVKNDMKWGDHLGNWFHDVGGWFGGKTTYKTDSKGNVIYDNDGNPILDKKEKNIFGRAGDTISNLFNKDNINKAKDVITSSLYTSNIAGSVVDKSIKTIDTIIKKYNNNDSEIDSEGKPLLDLEGKPIKKGKLADSMIKALGKITSIMINPIEELAEGANEWEKKQAPWKKSGYNTTAKGWFSNVLSKFFGNNINGNLYNMGGPDDSINPQSEIETDGALSQNVSENPESEVKSNNGGGNPLSKPFKISSPFGPRTLGGSSEYHHGIDLVPSDDSGQAEVSSRYTGTITSVKNDVPDNHTGLNVSSNKSGNYVQIDTDNGLRIKNYHLKAGSIPSNIKVGARVNVGDRIGEMGTTGRSNGPHLHYQIEKSPYESNNAIDPTSEVQGSSTISSFDSSTNSNYTSNYSSTGSSNSSGENKSPFLRLIELLKNIGGKFLNFISGGLFGNDSSESSNSSESGDASYGSSSTTSSDDYSNANCTSVDEFLKMVAKEIGTTEYPANSNKVKYNKWFYGSDVSGNSYPWCMAFVQWCFNNAGLALKYKTAGCAALLDWYRSNEPEKIVKDPKPGDIVIFRFTSGHHTGIVEKVNSASDIVTIEGNTSSSDKGSQSNGGGVFRRHRSKDIIAFIRAVDFEELSKKAAEAKELASAISDGNTEQLYAYLKSKGYTDEAISGILGCWTAESNNRANRIEADYLKKNIDREALANDREAMDEYTRNVVWANTRNVKENAYYGKDGHLYPGLGYAQWTGPRGEALLNYAKQKGMSWQTPGLQLDYLDHELNSESSLYGPKKYNVISKLNESKSPEDAVKVWAKWYEGSAADSKRINAAKNIYEQFKNSSVVAQVNSNEEESSVGVGGPDDNINSSISKSTYMPKVTSSNIGSNSYMNNRNYRSNGVTRSSSYKTSSYGSTVDNKYQYNSNNFNNIDIKTVINLMNDVITELRYINKNTGTSTNLLSQLNSKGTVNNASNNYSNSPVRSRGKSYSSAATVAAASKTNTRTISAMARPK